MSGLIMLNAFNNKKLSIDYHTITKKKSCQNRKCIYSKIISCPDYAVTKNNMELR